MFVRCFSEHLFIQCIIEHRQPMKVFLSPLHLLIKHVLWEECLQNCPTEKKTLSLNINFDMSVKHVLWFKIYSFSNFCFTLSDMRNGIEVFIYRTAAFSYFSIKGRNLFRVSISTKLFIFIAYLGLSCSALLPVIK